MFIPISQRSKLRFIEVQPHTQHLSICKGKDLGFRPRPSGSKTCAHNREVVWLLLDADLKNNFTMKHATGDCLFSVVQKHSRAHRSILFREEKWYCSKNHLKTSWCTCLLDTENTPRGRRAHVWEGTARTPLCCRRTSFQSRPLRRAERSHSNLHVCHSRTLRAQ